MELYLILGPMKSGKSYELISHFAPLKYTNIKFGVFWCGRHVRDAQVVSRNGSMQEAQKIFSLAELLTQDLQVVGIDEFHMFPPEDVRHIDTLLRRGTRVIVSSLDTDYQGKVFETVVRLFALGPKEVKYRRAVCETCKSTEAIYSQIYKQNEPLLEGMPPVVPEDGAFTYAPVCRTCFVRL